MRQIPLLRGAVALLIALLFTTTLTAQTNESGQEGELQVDEMTAVDSLIKERNSAAVVPFRDTLFHIYGNIGSISAKRRAETISENIVMLSKLSLFSADSLLVVEEQNTIDVVYRDHTIIGVTQTQSRIEGKPQEELANEYKTIILDSITKQKASKRWFVIVRRIVLSIALGLAIWYGIKYLNIFYRRFLAFVGKQHHRTFKQIHFLLDDNQQIKIAQLIIKGVRLFLILMILYFGILTFFRLYPGTVWLSDTLVNYIVEPLSKAGTAVVDYIPKLFTIIVIVILFRFLIKGLRVIAEQIEAGAFVIRGFHTDWAIPTFNIVRVILFIFMFIFIFPYLPNSESKIFQGVSVFMGVLFSLGSTSVIGNVVSGLVITYMRPFQVGDRIKMGEYVGDVIEKTPLVTRLKTPKNEVITIPNSTVMSAHTVNYTVSAENHGLILHSNIAGGYNFDWRFMHKLLLEAADRTEGALKSPAPFIHQTAIEDFYALYQVNIYVEDATKMSQIYSNLFTSIQEVFGEAGVELVAPHITAIRDASTVYMPEQHLEGRPKFNPPFQLKVEQDKLSKEDIERIEEMLAKKRGE